ncbi:Cna B-type domain-containing protein [Beduini massiliensis]|uniref:Cna B-type domain-containing protein n=1 Tax=Beduini massiliensis TaxID=1585974 RepID=UPI0006937704|nr:Cna B-type domain-containing protein [Beduini massiliensis]
MKIRKQLLTFMLTVVMAITALTPTNLVFAEDTSKQETEGFYYSLEQKLNEEQTEEKVTLTLHEKDNIIIQEVILPDGNSLAYSQTPINFVVFENGKKNFIVKYSQKTITTDSTDTKESIISFETTDIQKKDESDFETHTEISDTKNNEQIRSFKLDKVERISTGTKPFDQTASAGNDTSPTDAIVRSFDSAQYQMTYSGEISTDAKQVEIDFELSLNVSKKFAEFNTQILSNWMTDITQEDINGKCVLKGKTTYTYDQGVPGGFQAFSETKAIEINIKGMNQFEEVTPTFKVKISNEGDTQWQQKEMKKDSEKMIISAVPMYDIELVSANKLGSIGNFDFKSGTDNAPNKMDAIIYGRLMDFGVAVRLKAIDSDKGMKGIYIPEPTDTISFKIDAAISENGTLQTSKPFLWDYKENKRGSEGIFGRDLTNGSSDTGLFAGSLPLTDSNNPANSYTVNNGGVWEFKQNGDGSISVTVSGAMLYKDNGELHAPTMKGNGSTQISPSPSQGNLYLSTAFFEIVVPIDNSSTENKKYALTLTDSDMRISYKDGNGTPQIATNQTDIKNDTVIKDYETIMSGQYGLFHYLAKENQQNRFWGDNLSSDKAGMGLDAYALKGTAIQVVGAFSYAGDYISELESINLLMRIDDKAIQPSQNSSTGIPTSNNVPGNTTLLYAAKPGGKGWDSDAEMLSTKEEDLEYFKSMADLKAKYPNGVCVAVLAESRNMENLNENAQYTVGFNVDVLSTAKENSVSQTIHTIAFYNKDKNITSTDTRLNNSHHIKLNQPSHYLRENNNYEKAMYNDEHQVINSSAANASYIRGASLLIVGIEAGIEKKIDSANSSFDLSSGITFLPYQLQPVLNIVKDKEGTTIREMKIIDILPKQLKVTEDTKYYYGDNEIVPVIEVQADGTTRIIFTIENVKTGEALPKITFNAELNFKNIDLKELTHTVTNTSFISADGDYRSFSSEWTSHPNKSTVQAILVVNKSLNLSKQALDPLVEVDKDVRYRIAFTNTDALDYRNYKMLDILPFNGDSTGSNFSGSYTTSAKLTAPSSIELYISKDEDARLMTLDNMDIDAFIKVDPTSEKDDYKYYELPNDTKAILLQGTLPTLTQYVLDITLHTSDNHGKDVYANSASMKADGNINLSTPIAKAEVVERNLSGIAWIDDNQDGEINPSEIRVAGLIVNLYHINPITGIEELASDVLGNPCITQTNQQGEYKFEKLPSGTYRIEFKDQNGIPIHLLDYSLTVKNVGDNKINSKADAILDNNGQMIAADIQNITMPTLGEMKDENIRVYNKDYQHLGLFKIETTKTVTKVWEDNHNQDGIRPNEIFVQLYANHKEMGDIVILNSDNQWSYTWLNLAKSEGGKDITYSIKEMIIPDGYTNLIEINQDGDFILTNTHIPAVLEKTVTKIWDDHNDQDKMRPSQVLVQLYADDKEIGDIVTLNSDNYWSYTWSNLPKYSEGKQIQYSIKEIDIPNGYTVNIETDKNGNFQITNTLITMPNTPVIPDNPSKPNDILLTPNTPTDGPKTGDTTNINVFITLLSISITLCLLTVYKRKKQESL